MEAMEMIMMITSIMKMVIDQVTTLNLDRFPASLGTKWFGETDYTISSDETKILRAIVYTFYLSFFYTDKIFGE